MQQIPRILDARRTSLFCRLVANGVAQAAVMIATAWLVKITFDSFISSNVVTTNSSIAWCAAGLLGAAITLALLRMVERIDAERLGQHYVHEVRLGLFTHMSQLSPRLLQKRSRGGIMLRFIGDLNALKQWVSLGVARLTVATVTTIITLTILAFVNVALALLIGAALLGGGLLAFSLGGWLQNAVREARRRRVRLAANVNEKIAALAVMQVFGQAQRERRRVERQSQHLMNAMISRAKAVGAFRAAIDFTTAIASGGTLILGALLVSGGQTTAGTVVAAMSVVGLLLPALKDLGRVQEYWHGAQVSKEKITDFIAIPVIHSLPSKHNILQPGKGRLAFNNICINSVLYNFNAVAKPGQIVAIVGPNGAGKSTLLSLAARLTEPDSGSISIDGQDITTISSTSLRQAVSMMTPDLPLLRGTIDHNLRYRHPSASSEALAQARALCGIDELLTNWAEGEKTRVTEDGNNLSLGQRQRIGLARAILGNPRILLLDEVDANLDPCAMQVLKKILHEYKGTVLMITHRLDWIRHADQVWHIAEGKLIESGTPSSLLNGKSVTAQLFQTAKVVGV